MISCGQSVGGEGGGCGDATAGRDNEGDPEHRRFLSGQDWGWGSQWLRPAAWAVRVSGATVALAVERGFAVIVEQPGVGGEGGGGDDAAAGGQQEGDAADGDEHVWGSFG